MADTLPPDPPTNAADRLARLKAKQAKLSKTINKLSRATPPSEPRRRSIQHERSRLKGMIRRLKQGRQKAPMQMLRPYLLGAGATLIVVLLIFAASRSFSLPGYQPSDQGIPLGMIEDCPYPEEKNDNEAYKKRTGMNLADYYAKYGVRPLQ